MIKPIITYQCTDCNAIWHTPVVFCPVCCTADDIKYRSMFKIGDRVRTKKGCRINSWAKKEILVVSNYTGKSKFGYRITCKKPNGKKTPFIAKNLYKV